MPGLPGMSRIPVVSASPGMAGLPGPPSVPKLHSLDRIMERGREKEYLYARPTEEEDEEEEEEEWEYPDETQVYLRSKFYESWLWTDVDLPSQADRDG